MIFQWSSKKRRSSSEGTYPLPRRYEWPIATTWGRSTYSTGSPSNSTEFQAKFLRMCARSCGSHNLGYMSRSPHCVATNAPDAIAFHHRVEVHPAEHRPTRWAILASSLGWGLQGL